MKLTTKALVFAAQAHDGQMQDEGGDYINHPMRVAAALARDGYSEIAQAVAILHDVVEDTDVTVSWVSGVFGTLIGGAVEALTHREGESRVGYLERCYENDVARIVKLYDVKDNAARPPVADPERQARLDRKYAQAVAYLTS